MLEQDLEETTSRQLRLLLENEVGMELKEYREFLDRQMLRILGQMERPSQIYDYLFLVRVWGVCPCEGVELPGDDSEWVGSGVYGVGVRGDVVECLLCCQGIPCSWSGMVGFYCCY